MMARPVAQYLVRFGPQEPVEGATEVEPEWVDEATCQPHPVQAPTDDRAHAI